MKVDLKQLLKSAAALNWVYETLMKARPIIEWAADERNMLIKYEERGYVWYECRACGEPPLDIRHYQKPYHKERCIHELAKVIKKELEKELEDLEDVEP